MVIKSRKSLHWLRLKGEQLGQRDVTDMLCVSFSSPDYIGHAFGTHAIETEDQYIRLDQQLADLLNQLDASSR